MQDPHRVLIDSLEFPGKSGLEIIARPSYQRNRLTDIEERTMATSQPADGALQINSSTFGTLLSSQGSSAHRGGDLSASRGGTLPKFPGLMGGRKTRPRSRRSSRAPAPDPGDLALGAPSSAPVGVWRMVWGCRTK